MSKYAARAAVVLVLIGAAVGAFFIPVRHQQIWPFPETGRFLAAFAEAVLWIGVSIAVVFAFIAGTVWLLIKAEWMDDGG